MDEKVANTIAEMQKKMRGSMVELTKTYKELETRTFELIRAAYGTDVIRLPIDIEKIAVYLGISIELVIMSTSENRFSQILGHLTSRNGITRILLNGEVSNKTQRYTIAHAVGSYLLQRKQEEKFIFTSTYAIPLIPQSMEDIMADVVALFLLLPREVFQEEFKKYLEYYQNYPIDVNDWMEYLANKSQIPFFNLSIGYQQLKQMLSWEREEEFLKTDFDISKTDSFDIIFA